MRKIGIFIAATILMVIFGCKREHLYYESCDYTVVEIRVNWDSLANLSPKGATAIAYDSSGLLYKIFTPSSNSDSVAVTLPRGVYTVVIFNNSLEENQNTIFQGMDSLHTLAISASNISNQTATSVDTIAIATVENVTTQELKKEYFYNKPSSPTAKQELFTVASRITTLVKVVANITGIKYLSSQPLCTLYPLSSYLFLESSEQSSKEIYYEFNLNNLISTNGSNTTSVLEGETNTTGVGYTSENTSYQLFIDFTLINGEVYPLHFTIDNATLDSSTYQPTLYIEVDVEIPTIIGGDQSEGAFGMDLEGWDDAEAILLL